MLKPTKSSLLTVIAVIAGSLGVSFLGASARAEDILQKQGSLAPMRDEYLFEGESGQTVTITMASEEFDTLLILLDPEGEEIAVNDDYGGTLNSTIVTTLPASGSYTILAGSYSGQGGVYDVSVRPATEFEQAFNDAVNLSQTQNYPAAISAYSAAIDIDPSKPEAYMGRADAYWGQAYTEQGESFEGPQSLSKESRDAIIADYEKAADLLDTSGDSDFAQSLREQVEYLQTGEQAGEQTGEPQLSPLDLLNNLEGR
ncbi:MAG: PPC domain-containing protein [Leptolyngbyaceae cyanobacterium MO_188.B28]|nr:PPC domain-containing protein [Leptolyngbyaceae cyanobacterium MO_188.B28]